MATFCLKSHPAKETATGKVATSRPIWYIFDNFVIASFISSLWKCLISLKHKILKRFPVRIILTPLWMLVLFMIRKSFLELDISLLAESLFPQNWLFFLYCIFSIHVHLFDILPHWYPCSICIFGLSLCYYWKVIIFRESNVIPWSNI